MRSSLALLATFALGACSHVAESKGSDVVNITVNCSGAGVVATVAPWTAHTSSSTTGIKWHLNVGSGTTEATIEAKSGAAATWPFDVTALALPYRATANSDPTPTKRRNGYTPGATTSYTITAVCTPSSGPSRKVVIDPDMIVD